ncbi:MAG: SUMF1/EgtB/PvdO family nonheme iron enzyme [Planctomycetes bacterium]|nr:SUMF1/EgtB/PvdO family nonheme iron enzyme [Planctomycetota bacterium]
MTKIFSMTIIVLGSVWLVFGAASPTTQPATQSSPATGPTTTSSEQQLEDARQIFRQLISSPLTDADKARVEKLLTQLGGIGKEKRDKAEELLKKEPFAVLPLIRKACNSDDRESAIRAQKVVETFPVRKYRTQIKLGWAIATRQSAGDAAVVGDLIALLDDDEFAVRQKAGLALFCLTGQDFGYKAGAEPSQRAQAARKAREWWDKNKDNFVFKGFYGPEKELTLDLGNDVMMDMVLIPAGKFVMGSPEDEKERDKSEGPQREVTISRPFYMGIYEVTQEQYQQIMGKHAREGPTIPAVNISWDDAMEFCKKLSQKTGQAVTLPTEAQWEYACRAGGKTRFCYGDDNEKLGDYAWFKENNNNGVYHQVGQKKANDWGLYDMHGNVREWCTDWYSNDYAKAKNLDPQGPDSGKRHVDRGGGWQSSASSCRSASRLWEPLYPYIGFRVVVSLKAASPSTQPDTQSSPAAGPATRAQ